MGLWRGGCLMRRGVGGFLFVRIVLLDLLGYCWFMGCGRRFEADSRKVNVPESSLTTVIGWVDISSLTLVRYGMICIGTITVLYPDTWYWVLWS